RRRRDQKALVHRSVLGYDQSAWPRPTREVLLMSTTTLPPSSKSAVWDRLIRPNEADMSPEAAKFFLGLAFDPRDLDRMRELTLKNNAGTLSREEKEDLDEYMNVGLV